MPECEKGSEANHGANAGKDINNMIRPERARLDLSLEDSEGCHVPRHTDKSETTGVAQAVWMVQKFRNCFRR